MGLFSRLFAGRAGDKARKREGGAVTEWRYRVFGNDRGGSYSLSAEYDEKSGKVLILEERKETFRSRARRRRKRAGTAVLGRVDERISACGMKQWQGLGPSGLTAPDAATSSVTVVFADGTACAFNCWQSLPDGWRNEVDGVNSLLLEALER